MALGAVRDARRKVIAPLAMMPILTMSVLVFGLVIGLPGVARAHGVVVEYEKGTQAVQVNAAFDNGEPLSGAQVAVYAPGEASEPWVSGTTDSEGRFFFAPDPSNNGSWGVEVRKAGHGETIEIPVRQPDSNADGSNASGASGAGDADATGDAGDNGAADAAATNQAAAQGGAGFGPLQILLMAALGVWGLVGTALYFARRKTA